MRQIGLLSVFSCAAFLVACQANTVSSNAAAGQLSSDASASDSTTGDGEGPAGAYPPGPYGVSVNRIIQNFSFPGYFSTQDQAKANTLPYDSQLDLQTVRNALDSNGNPFRYLLLDISAGWCPPCNQEAQDLGLQGTAKAKIAKWLSEGGLMMTVLVEGYDESTQNPPIAADLDTWINQHGVQYSMAIDPNQVLLTQGINPSAFPTNLVIDLKTMKIISAWYGLDTTYQKWTAALSSK